MRTAWDTCENCEMKSENAVDLAHPYRLVFEKNGDKIQIANILEIIDYH